MSQRNNILQELNELQSSLANASVQNPFAVPQGYFESLADWMIRRVNAMDASDAREELKQLSPLLADVSRQSPYFIPDGYFHTVDESVMQVMNTSAGQTASEELEALSPLLSGLKKQVPYQVPAGYFEKMEAPVASEVSKTPAKLFSMSKRWFRYAAAAVITGVVAMSAVLILNKQNAIDPNEKPYAWVEKSLKKVNTETLDEFAALAEEGAMATVDTKAELREAIQVKEIMKDVPAEDIQEFLDETNSVDADIDNEEIFVN